MSFKMPPLPEPDYKELGSGSVGIYRALYLTDSLIADRRAALEAVAEYVDRNLMSAREYADELRAAAKEQT